MNLQNIKSVIVDDEKPAREALSNYLREFCPNVQVVAKCHSAKSAFKTITEMNPLLVFLDIEMPRGSGFDLLRMLEPINFNVIFITAYSTYAVQAFRFSATDFLLKPIKISDLIDAVNKVQQQIALKNSYLNIKTLLENISDNTHKNENLVIPDSKGFNVIKTSDIIFCEADGYCTRFYLTGNIRKSSSRNLKFYEEILSGYNFIRTHHSFLVNPLHVKGYSNYEEILLSEGLKCSLSTCNKPLFINYFKKH